MPPALTAGRSHRPLTVKLQAANRRPQIGGLVGVRCPHGASPSEDTRPQLGLETGGKTENLPGIPLGLSPVDSIRGGGLMQARDRTSRWGRTLAAAAGTGALVFTFACGGARDLARDVNAAPAQQAAAQQTGLPIAVSCEPNQRTIVRPTIVNGVAMSQVECVAADQAMYGQPVGVPYQAAPALTPVSYRTVQAAQPVYRDLGDARVVPVSAPVTAARPVRTRQVVYDERPVRKTRSVAKSAIIIGSSAGAGAGVGAIVGGKKGALIGAAIGGGGAAIWDQVTRRK